MTQGPMKRIPTHSIGISQGDETLFSDFENGGQMWTGKGTRESRKNIVFSTAYRTAPTVQASMSLWDIDGSKVMRADVAAENVSEIGFDLVFRTWGDTRVARVRVAWMAIGELPDDDQWELY